MVSSFRSLSTFRLTCVRRARALGAGTSLSLGTSKFRRPQVAPGYRPLLLRCYTHSIRRWSRPAVPKTPDGYREAVVVEQSWSPLAGALRVQEYSPRRMRRSVWDRSVAEEGVRMGAWEAVEAGCWEHETGQQGSGQLAEAGERHLPLRHRTREVEAVVDEERGEEASVIHRQGELAGPEVQEAQEGRGAPGTHDSWVEQAGVEQLGISVSSRERTQGAETGPALS